MTKKEDDDTEKADNADEKEKDDDIHKARRTNQNITN